MKNFAKILVLGAALVVAAPLVHADSIQFSGNMSFDTSTGAVTFDNTQSKVNVAGTGVLAPFTLGSATTFYGFSYNATPTGAGTELVSVIAPAPNTSDTLAFYMTSEAFTSSASKFPGFTNYDFSGSGYYTVTVGTTTTIGGIFDLTTQGVTGQTTPTGELAFSQLNLTTAATPEPSSLVMLGTGLVSAAGMLVRRRRVV